MKHLFTSRLLAALAFLLLLAPGMASAVPFTPGNLVVMRVGDGTASLSSASTAAYLQEYTPTGTLVQTIALPTALPTTGNNRILTVAGSSSTDGGLTRSANGAYLVVSGYDAAPGLAAISGTAPATTNRIVGRVAADGTVDTSTRLDDATGNLRSAASFDGTSFYTAGSAGGVRYVPFGNMGSSVVISATPSNLRYVNTFGGNLYISSGSSPYIGISQVGTGRPTTAGQTATLLPGFQGVTSTTAGISPLAFYFTDLSTTVPGMDVVYVADDGATTAGGGIQKWSLVGSTWVLNGTITNSVSVRGLDGMTNGTTVSLVASGNGGLYILSDNAGYNAAPSISTLPAPIATAASMTAFRGAAFAPVSSVVVAPAPTITSFTPTTGASGTTVTLTGTNLTGATAVTLNGTPITGFTVVNATTITFTVPATATSGTIAVTTPGGTGTSMGTFTFVPAATAPTITSFTPTTGAAATTVTLTGTNFTGATVVTLNGVAVTGFTVVNATTITFTVPATATSGTIAVTSSAGTGTSPTAFTVTVPVTTPTISTLSPARAVVGGPAFVLTVGGTNLTATTVVNFRGQNYTAATVNSGGTSITVNIPASAITTLGQFTVTATNGGTASNTLDFSVVAAATTVAFEDFEQGTRTSYTETVPTPVALRSGAWTFTQALIGDLFNDRVNQVKSARIRGGGSIAMNFDKPGGAGIVTISAATYGGDTGPTFTAEVSTDGGVTYQLIAGTPTTLTNTLTPYSLTVNRSGNVRLRFNTTNATAGANPRINLDDLNITNYTGTAMQASQAMPGLTVYPNPAQDRLTVALPTAGTATVALRDLTGRVVLASAPLAVDQQLRLPAALAAGVYLLEVRQGDVLAVRRITKE